MAVQIWWISINMKCQYCLCRTIRQLEVIEKQHKVISRWDANKPEYRSAISSRCDKERLHLLRSLSSNVGERRFMFSSMNRYASKWYWIVWVIRVICGICLLNGCWLSSC